jgi:prolyl-tRNA synthetase
MVDLPDKGRAFFDWYLAVLDAAQLTDKRYPVKGMNVWTPYGLQARRRLDEIMIRAIEATGSNAVEFPALIPATEFQKEKDHIKGFDAEVYWVTRGGLSDLDIPLVLRPTSETAMYPIFHLWVRSHKDLPLNVYQIVNTFRYETKSTRPFIRVREIHFFEEHTCQLDDAAAAERVRSNLHAFRAMADAMGLPYMALRRPEWDKFPGAYYSIAFDTPVGGARTLQVGTSHHYRENFSRPYEIQYEAADGSQRFVNQTTFGLSERLLGAVVAVHGDAKGVVFPSTLAPYQVVVIPILGVNSGDAPTQMAREVVETLRRAGVRAHLDAGEDRPGAKYYRWETAGVPLRIEIGRREAEGRQVTVADRLGGKTTLSAEGLDETIRRRLIDFDAQLKARAAAAFAQTLVVVRSVPALKESAKVCLVPWCGAEACGHEIERGIDGALLGTPEEALPIPLDDPGTCLVCNGSESVRWAVAAQQI